MASDDSARPTARHMFSAPRWVSSRRRKSGGSGPRMSRCSGSGDSRDRSPEWPQGTVTFSRDRAPSSQVPRPAPPSVGLLAGPPGTVGRPTTLKASGEGAFGTRSWPSRSCSTACRSARTPIAPFRLHAESGARPARAGTRLAGRARSTTSAGAVRRDRSPSRRSTTEPDGGCGDSPGNGAWPRARRAAPRERHRSPRPWALPAERRADRRRRPADRIGPPDRDRRSDRAPTSPCSSRRAATSPSPNLMVDGGGPGRGQGICRRRLRRLAERAAQPAEPDPRAHGRGERLGRLLERIRPGLVDRRRRDRADRRLRTRLGPLSGHQRHPDEGPRLPLARNPARAEGARPPGGGVARPRPRQRRQRHPRPRPRRLCVRAEHDAEVRHERGRHLDRRRRGRDHRQHRPAGALGRHRDRRLLDEDDRRRERDPGHPHRDLSRALDERLALLQERRPRHEDRDQRRVVPRRAGLDAQHVHVEPDRLRLERRPVRRRRRRRQPDRRERVRRRSAARDRPPRHIRQRRPPERRLPRRGRGARPGAVRVLRQRRGAPCRDGIE